MFLRKSLIKSRQRLAERPAHVCRLRNTVPHAMLTTPMPKCSILVLCRFEVTTPNFCFSGRRGRIGLSEASIKNLSPQASGGQWRVQAVT